MTFGTTLVQMKYNLQLGSCFFSILHLLRLSYLYYWFYKSLAFSFTTLKSYIHCILLWLSYPRVNFTVCGGVHVFTCKTNCVESFQYQVVMNYHRGPVVIMVYMIAYIDLNQHWAIHVWNKCDHFFFMYYSNNIMKMLVLHVTYLPCLISRRTQK